MESRQRREGIPSEMELLIGDKYGTIIEVPPTTRMDECIIRSIIEKELVIVATLQWKNNKPNVILLIHQKKNVLTSDDERN